MYWVYLKTVNNKPMPQTSFYTEKQARDYVANKLRIWYGFAHKHSTSWQYIIDYMGMNVATFAIG